MSLGLDDVRHEAERLVGLSANDDGVEAIEVTQSGRVLIVEKIPASYHSRFMVRTRLGYLPVIEVREPLVDDDKPWFPVE